jgi:hypothetical protein
MASAPSVAVRLITAVSSGTEAATTAASARSSTMKATGIPNDSARSTSASSTSVMSIAEGE